MSEVATYYTAIDFSYMQEPQGGKLAGIFEFESDEPKNKLTMQNVSKINFFVGPNNSGKSRFLRALFYNNDFRCAVDGFDFEKIKKAVKSFEERVVQVTTTFHGHFRAELRGRVFEVYRPHAKLQDLLKIGMIQRGNLNIFDETLPDLEVYRREPDRYLLQLFHAIEPVMRQWMVEAIEFLIAELNILKNNFPKYLNCPQVNCYIPILRGLRVSSQADIFRKIVQVDYFANQDLKETRQIFNGLDIHQKLTKDLLESSTARKKVMDYENFLSKEFFNSQEIQISPKSKDETVHIKIGDAVDLPIYSLGDGLQTIIMLTYVAFFQSEKTLFFVEEPEVYLHPGLQRRLIEVILNNKILNRHQWFFTTHSNHLLDLTLDYSQISVYRFDKIDNQKFKISQMTSPDHNLLSHIGVMASSLFRSNAAIWVEGVTDRRYFRELLRKNIKEREGDRFKEDIHYSFVELGGSNLVHFDFGGENKEAINVKRLVGHSFVIVDGDNDKADRIAVLKAAVSPERLVIHECKETENLLPEEVVRHSAHTLLKRSHRTDTKEKEMLNIEKIKFSEYFGQAGIGTYLDNKLDICADTKAYHKAIKDKKPIPEGKEPYFAAKSGTLIKKIEFCEVAVKYMKENPWAPSPQMEDISQKLITFIKAMNPNI